MCRVFNQGALLITHLSGFNYDRALASNGVLRDVRRAARDERAYLGRVGRHVGLRPATGGVHAPRR